MKRYIFTISMLVMLWPPAGLAQQRDSTRSEVQEDLEQALENIDPEEADASSEQLIQFLQELSDNPVNINHADLHDLRLVPGINLKLARAIISYRQQVKPFESPGELMEVKGIGRVTYEKAAPYITIGSGLMLSQTLYTNHRYWTSGGQFQMFTRYRRDFQEARGYRLPPEEGGYLGNPVKYYQRAGYKSDHFSVNITQEKDAGEQLPGPGRFDHQSWHLALEDNGRLQMLAVGDYSLSFGQGLVLWNGSAFGKGSDVTGSVNRSGRGIRPYTSAQETNFYRGLAATYGRRVQLTGFYSSRKKTATEITADSIRMPGSSGYHRTAREYDRRLNTGQTVYGGRLQLELPFGIVGATGYQTQFDRPVTAVDQPYARYDFEGTTTSTVGIDYTLLAGPAVVFGEAARSRNGGYGVIAGVESPLGEHTEVALAYRNYQKNFQSVLGNGFGEQSGTPQNEEGVYFGLEHTIGQKVTISAYMDQFRFPAARFGTHQSTGGYDWLGRAEVKLNSRLKAYLQVRSQLKEEEYEAADEPGRLQRKLGDEHRGGIRANLEYRANKKVRLRTRGEWVRSREAGEKPETGYLLYQDLRLQLRHNVKLDARVTVFDTDSYASRVYQFENDLLYVFGSRVLFDRGQRIYLLVNYEPFPFLELWAKAGITKYEDKQLIGSGLNEITGDTRSEIGLQARVRF